MRVANTATTGVLSHHRDVRNTWPSQDLKHSIFLGSSSSEHCLAPEFVIMSADFRPAWFIPLYLLFRRMVFFPMKPSSTATS